jgi:Ca-activated chloride channel homolog
LWVLLLVLALSGAVAQDGVSSAAASRTRYLGELGIIPTSREIVVEEIVNYHRHNIGRPKAGEAVHMDVRWGNGVSTREAVLQVGFSTALANDRQELRPLNLALVIDKSGSMAAADKMSRVKAALSTLVSRLRPTDILSITVFDSTAQVLLPAQEVLNPGRIKEIIAGIQPGSSTNIHAGLMLGYQEAAKNVRKDRTNRVILLTDGIANQGVTEPASIAKDSLTYNDRGIDLSTIGVGADLNKDLLRELAKSGRGLFHFVADTGDIQKVFVSELQSLISPVATDPNLRIELGKGLRIAHVYGYEPKVSGNAVDIKLDNMNSGLTQVVLVRVKAIDAELGSVPVTTRLTYYDLEQKKQVVKTEKTSLKLNANGTVAAMKDPEVRKNVTIATVAQAIRDMAAACEADKFREAELILTRAVGSAREHYPSQDDPDIKRTLATAERYVDVLRKRNAQEEPIGSEGPNLIPNGDFSQGNTGFVSGLNYVAPAYNALWPASYTVAPSFTQPAHLHRLISAHPYTSPERTNREQVMYANAGGTDTLVMWTATVKCEPNTTYRISFHGISLTPGQEWIPTYEIQVNGDRSLGQQPGAGVYNEISRTWHSGNSRVATVSIVKMPMRHTAGLVAIAAIKMVKSDR